MGYTQKIKRPFILLEVVIAVGLTAILLTVLFRFLVSHAEMGKSLDKMSFEICKEQLLQARLESVLTCIEIPTASQPSFYTAKLPLDKIESLIVLFHSGIDPDPLFSGLNTARLYLNDAGDFCLTQWTLSQENHRTETLFSDVRALEWEFWGLGKNQTTWGWQTEWPKKQGGVPSMIRLKLWCGIEKKSKIEPNARFAFILPVDDPIKIKK